ncbi:MAG: ECF transporter S component [Eubacteriales bacterium]|nr:ECF transporter S component [Eubacteriales bacterium]
MRVVYVGLFAALSYVVFTFFQVKVPLPGGDATSFHLGNAVVVIGALLLGGVWGGLGGAIGMTIGDLLDPVYLVYAPKTFFLKLMIGIITGLVAHRIFHLNEESDPRRILRIVLLSSAAGLAFNAVFDPLIGYFYKLLILGKPAADITLTWNIGVTAFNAVMSVIASTILYTALRAPLKKAGFFPENGKGGK